MCRVLCKTLQPEQQSRARQQRIHKVLRALSPLSPFPSRRRCSVLTPSSAVHLPPVDAAQARATSGPWDGRRCSPSGEKNASNSGRRNRTSLAPFSSRHKPRETSAALPRKRARNTQAHQFPPRPSLPASRHAPGAICNQER